MLPSALPSSRLRTVAASLLLLTVAPSLAHAQRPNAYTSTMHWVGTWGASPSSTTNDGAIASHAYNGNNQFANQTLRLIIHTSVGGGAVRIRLSNAFGAQAVTVGAAHVAVRDSGANIVAGTDRVLTFGGSPSIAIPNGADTLSDPVCLSVPALGDLAVSLYLPASPTAVMTVHELGKQTSYVSPANGGDASGATTFPTDSTAPTTDEVALLSGVEVYAPTATSQLTTFGDSITDGVGSTADANHRWPNILAQRLQAAGMQVGVVNHGISGDRVLNDQLGPNGESRFERDVLVSGNARWVTDLLGINDIGFQTALFPTQAVTAEQIIAGKRQFIARAHAMGLKIYGCTLLPFRGATVSNVPASYYSDAGEAKRQAVNAFVRAAGNYDAVIDFEAVMGDGATPPALNPAYDSGDHLHPNDAGYQAMANAVPLSLFQ